MNRSLFQNLIVIFIAHLLLALPAFSFIDSLEEQLEMNMKGANKSYSEFVKQSDSFTSKTKEFDFADFIDLQKKYDHINNTYFAIHFLLAQDKDSEGKTNPRSEKVNDITKDIYKLLIDSEFKYSEVLKFLKDAKIKID